MTNGEAVNWLINISADIGKAEHRDLWHYEQALYEIREMLESAQPELHYDEWCADCKEYDTNKHCCPRWNQVIRQTLKDAQPEQQWIPCSKTKDLPKHEVLCCDKYGEELIGWLSYSDDQWLCESDCEMMYDPIAWREKPEPWRGEEHG